jgi:hypothetical protein
VWLLLFRLVGKRICQLTFIGKGIDMKIMNTIAAIAVMASAAQLTVGQTPAERGQDQQRLQEQQNRDQLRAAVQEICPISGEKLGSMGAPIKVKVGKENIFVCCKGCLKQKIKPEHWTTIHANVARAQGICPVMKHKLPKKPKWTIVEGQLVYVCCPPCRKKIAAEPEKYLRAVDELFAASLDAKKKFR